MPPRTSAAHRGQDAPRPEPSERESRHAYRPESIGRSKPNFHRNGPADRRLLCGSKGDTHEFEWHERPILIRARQTIKTSRLEQARFDARKPIGVDWKRLAQQFIRSSRAVSSRRIWHEKRPCQNLPGQSSSRLLRLAMFSAKHRIHQLTSDSRRRISTSRSGLLTILPISASLGSFGLPYGSRRFG